MRSQRRRHIYIDHVQTVLVVRVVAYWLYCLLAATLIACCWIALTERPASSREMFLEVFRRYGVALGATLALLPLVVLDVLRLSHRFVGPVFRLRQALREAAEGRPVRPIQFRDNDFWREVADDFNRAFARRTREAEHDRSQTPVG